VDPLFITKENFEEAIDYLPNPRLRKILKTPLHIRSYMEDEANMKKKFHGLE
jgi:hypothetical protein